MNFEDFRFPDFDLFAAGETLAVHLWYVNAIGLVSDKTQIANGIGALLILVILIFNLAFGLPIRYFHQKALRGSGH